MARELKLLYVPAPSNVRLHVRADANQKRLTMKRGYKLVVDVERQKCEDFDITVDEARAMAADMTARLAALKRQWEESGDPQALFGALNFYQLQLPKWFCQGLMQTCEQQFKNPDAIRFLAVRHAHDVSGMTLDESYDWASENVTDPAAKGGPRQGRQFTCLRRNGATGRGNFFGRDQWHDGPFAHPRGSSSCTVKEDQCRIGK